ncbi:hypothetical protein RSOLAG1IB_03540 [Rhizoctonia solani AG-1 IB]|uniref:Uncharacterized protein n=1 Tax=Thanatephorus cucumeris (strain AG1-IB / isolate 7/3/14) TaxID=1108050 RepID=A0A0B7FTW2_THACB|nr:hypothetical protein RSOLAG1IB_03540 [Rhizoctonia solani AG-1 IB]
MEDVVFTLNNIVDDIARMYADATSRNDTKLVDSLMDVDIAQKSTESEHKGRIDFLTRSDPLHSPEPPLSARSDKNSEFEGDTSLYSASLEPSPTSSRFTTPPLSPASFASVTGGDSRNLDVAGSHPPAKVDQTVPSAAPDGILFDMPNLPERSLQTDGKSVLLESPGSLFGAAPFPTPKVPSSGLELNSDSKLLRAPNLFAQSSLISCSDSSVMSARDGVEIIYQTSVAPGGHMPGVSPPHLTKAPRLPPRPIHPRDSPPHLPALRPPSSQFTPRLGQNEDWTAKSLTRLMDLGAEHLVKQRGWARVTITHASSLAEPRDLPPCRPVDKYLAWRSYSSHSISPPRKRILGAMGRRVHIGPRMLARGDWDPDRRGGTIDRWNNREGLRRERTRASETEKEFRSILKPVVPLSINTSRDFSDGLGITHQTEEVKQECRTAEEDRDAMRLCVRNGRRVSSGPVPEAPGFDSELSAESLGSLVTSSVPSPPMDADPHTMRWCVKNGALVLPQPKISVVDSGSKPEAGPVIDSTYRPAGIPTVSESLDTTLPYVPKKRSPLYSTLLPISPTTMGFQPHTLGEALGAVRPRRKFASMIF